MLAPEARPLLRDAACLLGGVLLAGATTPATALLCLLGALGLALHGRGRADLHQPPLGSAFAAGLALNALYAWLVTHGDFHWDTPEVQGSAYDALAASLRRGAADLDPAAIRGEAWKVGDKTYMYFGPFPALLRELPDLLLPRLAGHWSRLSVQLADALSLAACSALARQALAANPRLDTPARDRAYLLSLLALGVGSPLVVLGSVAHVYHEAIAWALAPTLWGLYFAFRLLDQPPGQWTGLWGLSAMAAVALLSRLTFGGATYGLLAVVLGLRLWALRGDRAALRAAARAGGWALLPALAGVALQLWYNAARFGSPLRVADFSAYEGTRPLGAGPSSPLRIPSGLWAYFSVHADNFRARAPFLAFVEQGALQKDLFQDRTTPIFPIWLSAPWGVLALAGAVRALWRERRADLAALALPLLAECALVLGYYFLGYRFVIEFVPLLAWGLALYLRLAMQRPRALATTAVAGALITVLSLFHYQSIWWAYPPPYQAQVRQALAAVDRALGLHP